MDMEGEEAFQVSTLKDYDWYIYYVMISQVFLVVSFTFITIERACCLYALLTEILVDFGSFIIVTMKGVRMANLGTTFPYGALITQIAKHTRVSTKGLI
jgi:hypothetical protein